LSELVAREANVLAYIDGFWLCFWLAIAALSCVALTTWASPGPFTPVPFRVAKAVLKRSSAENHGTYRRQIKARIYNNSARGQAIIT
jgi:DHA2 family multidrug resistance protein